MAITRRSNQPGLLLRSAFRDANLDANLALVDALRTIADCAGVSVAQAAIERAIPKDAAAGDRCPAAQMAHLDSGVRNAR